MVVLLLRHKNCIFVIASVAATVYCGTANSTRTGTFWSPDMGNAVFLSGAIPGVWMASSRRKGPW